MGIRRLTIGLIIISAVIIFSGCHNNTTNKTEKMINVSIMPQKYFVDRLTNQKYEVNVVVKPGYNPETYEPSLKQMTRLEQSTLYLQICKNGFDQVWVEELKQLNNNIAIVDLSEGIDLITSSHAHDDHHHKGVDPHIWVSPASATIMVDNILQALLKYFPEDSTMIMSSYVDLKNDLIKLDSTYRNKLSPYINKTFLVYHPVMTYIARDYNLNQLSIETDGKEPSLKQMSALINDAQAKKFSVIFIQKEFDTKNAQLIAKETGAKIIIIDPLDIDWLTNSYQLLNYLVDDLSKNNIE